MAQLPLNTFKTKTQMLSTASNFASGNTNGIKLVTVYTAPIGVTSIVLMSQISNVSTTTQTLSFIHHRRLPVLQDAQGNGKQDANIDSYLVKDFGIPPSDAASPLTGKMIVESLDSIRAFSSSENSLQLVLSILETANN
jgi:hypothetical protein